MDRHRVVAVVAAALLAVALAGCGGSSTTPSPSASEATTEAPVPSAASSQPSAPVASPTAAPHTTAAALCPGVAMRKQPKSNGDVIVRSKAGTKVRVVEVVIGDAYTAGSCGMSGNSWLKVDRIGGKSIQKLYGVPFGYVAAGFFH